MVGRSKVVALFSLFAAIYAGAQCDSQSRVPLLNAPYSAVRQVVTLRSGPDGTQKKSQASSKEARDSEGRTYRAGERVWVTADGVEHTEMLFRISDPVANSETSWDTNRKVVKIVHFGAMSSKNNATNPADVFSLDKLEAGTPIGEKTIEGLSVRGMRFKVGNGTHECWFSKDLNLVVLQTDEYPDSSFVSRLENVKRGQPDISEYALPTGYAVSHVHLDNSER
jgi:hypothetical protein